MITKVYNKDTIRSYVTATIACGLVLMAMLSSALLMHADPSTSLGTNLVSASTSLLNEVEGVYCGSLCWLIFGIEVLILCISKNDKVIGVTKRAVIGCIVAYIVLKILVVANGGVIGSTVDTVSGWVNGT